MDTRERVSRWTLAFGLWGCAAALAKYGYNKLDFIWLIPATILTIIGVSRIFWDLVEIIATPFTAFIDAVVFPRHNNGKPDANYHLPEYYIEQERYDEAEIEYRRILKHHPREVQAWLGLIELLIDRDQKDEARRIYEKGRRRLRHQPGDLSEVEMHWQHLQNRAYSI